MDDSSERRAKWPHGGMVDTAIAETPLSGNQSAVATIGTRAAVISTRHLIGLGGSNPSEASKLNKVRWRNGETLYPMG